MRFLMNYEITKTNLKRLVLLTAVFTTLLPRAVYADSSWIWLTRYRPWDFLPPVTLATIVIEVLAIWLVPHTDNFRKTALVVIIANVISFVVPYAYLLIDPLNPGYPYLELLESGPYYIISGFFVFLTLFLEVPIVYNLLKKHVESKKKLFWTIIISNIATTAMVAVIERMITHGEW